MGIEAYDVVIIGAGPSGIGAATVLAEYSLKILLIDENNQIGGQIWRKPAYQPVSRFRDSQLPWPQMELSVGNNLHITTPSCVLGVFPDKHLLLSTSDQGVREIKTRRIIFATGAREKVLPFKGWTLPGVMTLGAAQILLKQYGVLASSEILIAGAGPLAYLLSSQIIGAGGKVTTVLDRSSPVTMLNAVWVMAGQLPKIGEGLLALGRLIKKKVSVKHRMQVVEVKGKDRLQEVIAVRIAPDGTTVDGSQQRYETQMLACGNGFVPNIELPQLAGCDLTYAVDKGGWIVKVDRSMETSVSGVFAAGEITGIAGGDKSLIEGRLAALSILNQFGKLNSKKYRIRQAALLNKRKHCQRFGAFLNRQWAIHPHEWAGIDDATIICRCEDITMGTIRGWIKKGIKSAPDLKRATRCGMGICQGRTCAPLIYEILAACSVAGKQEPHPLSVRTPVKPIPLGDLARL
ncbi:FAD-dependent oxidoreductase [Desulfococcaceae bacterium HSG7]|nr:FAD-dependent oxidoreductase [Desulfococcaceae bacterium HSG7]